jgi:hypothetical protein
MKSGIEVFVPTHIHQDFGLSFVSSSHFDFLENLVGVVAAAIFVLVGLV